MEVAKVIRSTVEGNYLMFKGKPLVRKGNEIYYGDMSEKCVVRFEILSAKKDGKFETVQCKCTGSQSNTISLKSCGGTKGETYDNVLNHSGLDKLFCVDVNGNMYVIPVSEIRASGNTKQITLRTEPTANNQGFQTHKFRVQFSFQAP